MPRNDGVVSISIDYKSELNQMIADYEAALNEIASNKSLSKGMKSQFNNVAAELKAFKADVDKAFAELGASKVNTSSFKSFKQTIEKRFDGISQEIERLDLAVSTINSQLDILGSGVDISGISQQFKEFQDYVQNTHKAIDLLVADLGEQGISLVTFDAKEINNAKSQIREINDLLEGTDLDSDKKSVEYESLNTEQARTELNSLISTLDSTLGVIKITETELSELDDNSPEFNKTINKLNILKLKAADLNDSIEQLNDIVPDENGNFLLNVDDNKVISDYKNTVTESLDEIRSSAEETKNQLEQSVNIPSNKQAIAKIANELNPNSAQLVAGVTIEATTDELWKKLSPVIDGLQRKLNSNPVIAPVSLVVAANPVSANGNVKSVSNTFSKKYQKVLATTGEDAVIDLEGVYKKTFTSIMDSGVSYAKETIKKIQEIFSNSPIKLNFDFNETEFKTLTNALLSNDSDKKYDITGEIASANKEVGVLSDKLKEVYDIANSSKDGIKISGLDTINTSLDRLSELQNVLDTLKNIEKTLAHVGGVSSVSDIEEQWDIVSKKITNAVKLDGSFRKNVNVEKLASEYNKYLQMGGTNDLSSINKIKDNDDVIESILLNLNKIKNTDISSNSIETVDSELNSVKSTTDDIIERFDHLISLTANIGNKFYALFKELSISDADKQWTYIEDKFQSIADSSDQINLSKQKNDIQELIASYQKYLDIGGTKTFFDLTDNAETIKKLDKVYTQLSSDKNASEVFGDANSSDNVKKSVDSLTDSFNAKTDAIKASASTMELAAESEIKSIQKIIDALNPLVEKIQSMPKLNLVSNSLHLQEQEVQSNSVAQNQAKSSSQNTDTSSVIEPTAIAVKNETSVLKENTRAAKENVGVKEQIAQIESSTNYSFDEKGSQKYWNGRFKETISNIGKTNDELAKMKTYYQDLEKESEKQLKNNEKNKSSLLQSLDKYISNPNFEISNVAKKLKDNIKDNLDVTSPTFNTDFNKYSDDLNNIKANAKDLNNVFTKQKSEIAEIVAMLEQYREKNSNMSLSQRNDLDEIINDAKKLQEAGSQTVGEVDNIKKRFADLKTDISKSGNTGLNLIDRIRNRAVDANSKFIAQFLSWQDWIRYIRTAANAVIELNTDITELAKVSEQTSEQIYDDFSSYATIAKELGATISDTISATTAWSKNGYNIADSKELAEVSLLYKNVGDGIDIDAANESLVSTLKGFQLEADQAEHIIDVFNEVSNNEAITSSGIGEALQQSAASFNAANTTLEQSVALVTATNSVLQDTARTGNMWKTVSARIRGAKTELTELGEDTDGLVESTSKLRSKVMALTGVDIMEDENTFKNIYDIVLEIGEVWESLSDINQASLLELLAGKNQSNALAAALSNVDVLKKAYEEATGAEGSATREQEKYQQSIQYSIDQTKASLEELYGTLVSADFLKSSISFVDNLIDGVTRLIDKFGLLSPILTGVGSVMAFKGVNFSLDGIASYFKPQSLFSDEEIAYLELYNSKYTELSDIALKTSKSIDTAAIAEEAYNATLNNASGSLKRFVKNQETGTIAVEQFTKASKALTLVKSLAKSFAVGAVISVVTNLVGAFVNASENAREAAKELSSTISEEKSSLKDYREEITELNETINSQSSSFEEVSNARSRLLEIQQSMIDTYGTEYGKINNITDAINGEAAAWEELSQKRWKEYKAEYNNVSGFGGIANNVLNAASGSDSRLERSVKEFGNYSFSIDESTLDMTAEELEKAQKAIQALSTDATSANVVTYDINGVNHGLIQIQGNASDAYDILLQLQELLLDYGVNESITNNWSTKEIAKAKEATDSYADLFEQYVLYEEILADGSKYKDIYGNITKAYTQYNDALNAENQNENTINQTHDVLMESISSAINDALENGDTDIVYFFKNIYPDLSAEISSWSFDVKFNADADNLKTTITTALSKLDGFSTDNLNDFDKSTATNEQIAAYNELEAIANRYYGGMSGFVDKLESLGYIRSNAYNSLVDIFGDNAVKALDDNSLQLALSASVETANEIKSSYENSTEALNALVAKQRALNTELEDTLSYTDRIAEVESLSTGFDQLDKIYADVYDKEDFDWSSVLNNDDFEETFSEYTEAYNEFIQTISNSPNDINACQSAFNKLADEYIKNSDALKDVTEETKAATVAMLEQMGVVNADEIVSEQIATNLLEAKIAATDFASATSDDINALFAYSEQLGLTAGNVYSLLLAQIDINNNPISAVSSLAALQSLMNGADITAEKMSHLLTIIGAINNVAKLAQTGEATESQITAAKQLVKHMQDEMANVSIPKQTTVNYGGGTTTKSAKQASDSGSSDGDAYVDAFEEALEKLEQLKDDGVISEKQYLDSLRLLYERYFKDIAGYEDKYLEYRQQYLEGYKSLYEDVINYCVDIIDKQIDALNDQQEAQTDALEAQKDSYQNIIDSIQEQIDAIQDANDERERSIQLQKDEYELQRAQNQRVNKVYRNSKGYVYETDQQSIRDAKEQVDSDKTEIQIAQLQKQIDYYEELQDKIDDQIDATEKYYENLIENLEKSKEAYQDLLDLYENSQLSAKLHELGITEADILNGSVSAFNNIKIGYLGILADMNRGNMNLLSSLSEMSGIDLTNLTQLGDTASYLNAVASTAEGIGVVGTNLTALSDAANQATTALGGSGGNGSGTTASKTSSSGGASSTTASSGGTSSLSSAVDDVTSKAESVQALANEFNPALTEAINSATTALGGGGYTIGGDVQGNIKDTKAKGGGTTAEYDSNTLTGALQAEEQAAFSEEKGIPAQTNAFNNLTSSVKGVNTELNNTKTILEGLNGKTFECTVNIVTNGNASMVASAGGTLPKTSKLSARFANAQGNLSIDGTAYAKGSIGATSDYESLVGELGSEIVVRGNRWFTVGNNGAEFFNVKKGDIIFSADQTRKLLEDGHISTRGYAHANGTIGNDLPDGFIPYSSANTKLTTVSNSLVNAIKGIAPSMNALKDGLTAFNSTINNIKTNNVKQQLMQTVNISLPNITDGSHAKDLMFELQGIAQRSSQYFAKRK